MVKQMKTGSTARQIDLGKGSGRPAMMTTELERAGAERRALYHSQRWLRVRRQFLMDHPLCIECEREGLVVAAVVVDHRLGHQRADWRERFWDTSTLQGLCLDCHAKKSAAELAEWVRAGGAYRRTGIGGG
jgi:5-methylcytosine-specific restriction enzyme A